ncbi:hypothetical protein AAY473_030900 [Plecturocebus cupreus]
MPQVRASRSDISSSSPRLPIRTTLDTWSETGSCSVIPAEVHGMITVHCSLELLGSMAHACNPSTLGGRDRRITLSKELDISLANMSFACRSKELREDNIGEKSANSKGGEESECCVTEVNEGDSSRRRRRVTALNMKVRDLPNAPWNRTDGSSVFPHPHGPPSPSPRPALLSNDYHIEMNQWTDLHQGKDDAVEKNTLHHCRQEAEDLARQRDEKQVPDKEAELPSHLFLPSTPSHPLLNEVFAFPLDSTSTEKRLSAKSQKNERKIASQKERAEERDTRINKS